MLRYTVKRILSLIPVVFIISIMLFGLTKLMPGDPAKLMVQGGRPETYDARVEAARKSLGLDQDVVTQYVKWMGNLAHGDLGVSSTYQTEVKNVVAEPLKNTIFLNFFVLIFSLGISILVGIRSAVKKGSFFDQFWQVFSLIGMSVPTFFVGLCLIFIFAFKLGWLPSFGMPEQGLSTGAYITSWFRHLILPVTTLTVIQLAGTMRYVRNAMLEVLSQDFIRTARSKGLSQKVIVYSHAFRNALIPVVTIVITQIGMLFSGSMITETVFQWNGLGFILLKGLQKRDLWLVVSMNLFYVVIYLISNFIADITYALVDPRVKLD